MAVTRYSEEELLEEERRTTLEKARMEEDSEEESEEEETSRPMYSDREEENEEKKEPRISTFTAILMLVFVSTVELAQFGLTFLVVGVVVSPIIAFCAQMIVTFWFWMKGVSFRSAKKIITIGVSMLIEFIPGLDVLPGFLLQVIAIILMTKAEDGALGKIASTVPGGKKLTEAVEKTLKKA